MNWEELKKIAETNKFNAETNKAEAEKIKIEFETAELKKEASRKWWLKLSFRKQLISIILGAGILGFYINYFIIPMFNAENFALKLQNQKAEERIFQAQNRVMADSLNLAYQLKITDSLKVALQNESNDRKKLDALYKEILKSSELEKMISSKRFKQLTDSARMLERKYNQSKKVIDDLSSDIKLYIVTVTVLSKKNGSRLHAGIYMGKAGGNGSLFSYDGKGTVNVEAGVYDFFARAEGFRPEMKTVTISNDIKTHKITFFLNEGPDITPVTEK